MQQQRIGNINQIDFLLGIEARKERDIDLSALTFIKPVGVVALLTTLERYRNYSGDSPVALRLPEDSAVRDYLVRAGVYDVIRGQGWPIVDLPEVPELVGEGVRQMVPCTRFREEACIETLAAQMEERFHTTFAGLGSLLGTLDTIFSELAMNVVHHAESGSGYVLAQEYKYQSGPIVEIAVADCGIGIRASLEKNPHNPRFNSDSEAIESATLEGVSSTREDNRGYGLYYVTDDLKRDKSRLMTIRSGTGIITVRGHGTVVKREGEMRYSGTIVSVTIPCG